MALGGYIPLDSMIRETFQKNPLGFAVFFLEGPSGLVLREQKRAHKASTKNRCLFG